MNNIFKAGDRVKIDYSKLENIVKTRSYFNNPSNKNKTYIIKSISGNSIYFNDEVAKLMDTWWFYDFELIKIINDPNLVCKKIK